MSKASEQYKLLSEEVRDICYGVILQRELVQLRKRIKKVERGRDRTIKRLHEEVAIKEIEIEQWEEEQKGETWDEAIKGAHENTGG